MKQLFENWRKFIDEDEEQPSTPKAIFMAGGPGSGKTTILKKLNVFPRIPNIINADAKYEADLRAAGLALGDKPALFAQRKELVAELENLDPESQEYKDREIKLVSVETILSKYATAFSASQVQKKADIRKYIEPPDGTPDNFIVDGTGGNSSELLGQKSELEAKGYDVAMIFVDLDVDTALERNRERGQQGGRQLLDSEVEGSHTSVKKRKGLYQNEFGNNFFYVNANDDKVDADISKAQPAVDAFLESEQLEEADWQKHVRATYDGELKRVLRGGGNNTKAKPFGKKARIDYRGSAPPGDGGS